MAKNETLTLEDVAALGLNPKTGLPETSTNTSTPKGEDF